MRDDIIELRQKGWNYKQIAGHLGCAISTVSYNCQKVAGKAQLKITAEVIEKMQPLYDQLRSLQKVATSLGVSKTTVLKYVETVREAALSTEQKRINNVQGVISWRQRKKAELIKYKGGACEHCGYNKSTWALQFHHRDPSQKDMNIGGKSVSFETLKTEVDKCLMLCANCHAEEHERLNADKKQS